MDNESFNRVDGEGVEEVERLVRERRKDMVHFFQLNTYLTEEQRRFVTKTDAVVLRVLASLDATLKRAMVGWSDKVRKRYTKTRLQMILRDLREMDMDIRDLQQFLALLRREIKAGRDASSAVYKVLGYAKYQPVKQPKKRGRKPRLSVIPKAITEVFGVENQEELRALAKKVVEEGEQAIKEQLRAFKAAERAYLDSVTVSVKTGQNDVG